MNISELIGSFIFSKLRLPLGCIQRRQRSGNRILLSDTQAGFSKPGDTP